MDFDRALSYAKPAHVLQVDRDLFQLRVVEPDGSGDGVISTEADFFLICSGDDQATVPGQCSSPGVRADFIQRPPLCSAGIAHSKIASLSLLRDFEPLGESLNGRMMTGNLIVMHLFLFYQCVLCRILSSLE